MGELLNGLFVEGEETLNFVAEVDVERSDNGFVLLTGLNVQELLDLVQVLVLLEFLLGFSLGELLNESSKELGDGVSGKGDLEWGNSSGSVSEAEEGLVGSVVGDERVLTLDPLQFLLESRVDFLEELRLNKQVWAGKTGGDWLNQGKDGTGLLLLNPGGSTERAVQLGVLFQGASNESTDTADWLEPGGHGNLLPQSGIGGAAVEQHGVSGHADFRVLTTVESSGGKDGENLLLNNFVGQRVVGLTVNGRVVLLLSVFLLVQLLARLDQFLEGIDSLDLDQRVGFLIQDLLDWLNDFRGSEVAQSLEHDNGVVDVLLRFTLETLLELLDEVGNVFAGNLLLIAEFSVKGNGVAGVLDALVDAGLVSKEGEGQDGAGADLLLLLDLLGVDQLLNMYKHKTEIRKRDPPT